MADFHTLRIKQVKKETADTVSISFDVPKQLRKLFSYRQGQYLTLKKKINGEDVRRSYSLCSSPHTEDDWRVAVKAVEGGVFSTFANEYLAEGDLLDVMPPEGNFYTELKAGQKQSYVAFAAGSGITPILSIIKSTLHIETESTFALYYGNRDDASIIFKEELLELKEKFGDRFNLNFILSRQKTDAGFHGRINADACEEFAKTNTDLFKADHYFLCGPEEMIFGVKDKLESKGVKESDVHFELFTTPIQAEESQKEIPLIDSEVTVIIDGEEFNLTLSSKGDNILDAAMDSGADVPFSCKGAVCCTCRAKVMEGKVQMAMNYALTDEEVEDGYVLTCQSHPISSKVVIDYDQD
ncbi:MAG: FAD-binding oxidoreductase [Vicingaceae bacterium]